MNEETTSIMAIIASICLVLFFIGAIGYKEGMDAGIEEAILDNKKYITFCNKPYNSLRKEQKKYCLIIGKDNNGE